MIEPPKNRQKEANYIHSLACRAEPCVRNLYAFRCLAFARHDKGNDVYLPLARFAIRHPRYARLMAAKLADNKTAWERHWRVLQLRPSIYFFTGDSG